MSSEISIFKAVSEILPCSTFISYQEESFVEQVYSDICTYSVNPQPSGKHDETLDAFGMDELLQSFSNYY